MTIMARGIIYVMATAVPSLVKIGQTKTDNYKERMRNLEANGYHNITGLKCFFAVELENYGRIESLLHDIFSKHRVGDSEIFDLDRDLVKQLLLTFDGKVIYPEGGSRESEFKKEVTKIRKQGALFNFYKKGLKDGDRISFIADDTVTATVAGERKVEYAGKKTYLSPLTYRMYEDRGKLNESGAYQGAHYWQYKGKRLKELPDK